LSSGSHGLPELKALLKSPEAVIATWRAANLEGAALPEATVREALERLDPLWDELFPAEQARIVQLANSEGRRKARRPCTEAADTRSGERCPPADRGVVSIKVPLAIRKRPNAGPGSRWRSDATGGTPTSTTRWSRRSPARFGARRCRIPAGTRRSRRSLGREDQPIIRHPGTTSDVAGARHSRGDTRWTAAGGDDTDGVDEAISD